MRTALLLRALLVAILMIVLRAMPAKTQGLSTSSVDTQALDDYIAAQMSKHGIRGVALAVTSGTEIVYLKGYGTAGSDRPLTPQTPMYIGSVSKSFTGLAVAQLIEEGKIDPNQPVQAYLPWFSVADPDASKRITVRHFLHHTSGLSEAGYLAVLPDDATNEDAVRSLASAELTAPVGEKHQYFNTGYDVLALLIQTVSGLPYEQYVQENIFDRLQMTRTYTDPALARANGLAQGYTRFFGFVVPQTQPHRRFDVSAGYIISTAEDMAHYMIALNNNGLYRGESVLSFHGMERLFTPVQGYAMGWFVENGHIFHGGANETFKTFVDLYPLRRLGIVLLINQGYLLDHMVASTQLFKGVEAIVLGRIPPPVSEGWSVKYIGWALLAIVLALSIFQIRNLLSLRDWQGRCRDWTLARRIADVALSFLIPTVILIAVFSQLRAYFGYRFNLTVQMINMARMLTDITILMIVGSLPDYIQCLTKLYWLIGGSRVERAHSARAVVSRERVP
jgi:CubicO group peptidase (beta-lactamase class C family)